MGTDVDRGRPPLRWRPPRGAALTTPFSRFARAHIQWSQILPWLILLDQQSAPLQQGFHARLGAPEALVQRHGFLGASLGENIVPE